jgi:hypothetical protein
MARAARKTGMALVWHIVGLAWTHPGTARLRGGIVAAIGAALAVAFATYNAADPSLNAASAALPTNALGLLGAAFADIGVQSLGLACAPWRVRQALWPWPRRSPGPPRPPPGRSPAVSAGSGARQPFPDSQEP